MGKNQILKCQPVSWSMSYPLFFQNIDLKQLFVPSFNFHEFSWIIRDTLLKSRCVTDPKLRRGLLTKLMIDVRKELVPIRLGWSFRRDKNPTRKAAPPNITSSTKISDNNTIWSRWYEVWIEMDRIFLRFLKFRSSIN